MAKSCFIQQGSWIVTLGLLSTNAEFICIRPTKTVVWFDRIYGQWLAYDMYSFGVK